MSTQFKVGDMVRFNGYRQCGCISKHDSYVTERQTGLIEETKIFTKAGTQGGEFAYVTFDNGYHRWCCGYCLNLLGTPDQPITQTWREKEPKQQDTPQPKNDKDKNEPFVLYRRHRKFSFRLDR